MVRHPGKPHLLRYVGHRKEVLAAAVEATGVAAEDAKLSFLQLCYGGTTQSWCTEHGVAPEALPPFVAEFDTEQAAIRKEDADKKPELLQRIVTSGAERPEVTLQSMLNMKREREVLDAMAGAEAGWPK